MFQALALYIERNYQCLEEGENEFSKKVWEPGRTLTFIAAVELCQVLANGFFDHLETSVKIED